jgi:hypothetical protein
MRTGFCIHHHYHHYHYYHHHHLYHDHHHKSSKCFICIQDGDTALMRASRYGYVEIVRTVLEYGADVGVKNNVRNLVMMIMMMMMVMMLVMIIVFMSIRIISHRWIILFLLLFAPSVIIRIYSYVHMNKCEL